MKSNVDSRDFDIVPKFLYDDVWAYRKYEESLFNEKINAYNFAYSDSVTSFEYIDMPADFKAAKVTAMKEFLKEHPQPNYAFTTGMITNGMSKTVPRNLRLFKQWLVKKFGDDINAVNLKLGTEYVNWNNVSGGGERYLMRRDKPLDTDFSRALNEFKSTLPLGELYYFSIIGFYRKQILQNEYSRKIAKFNEKHGSSFSSYKEVPLARRYSANASKLAKEDWERFVRELLGIQYIKVDRSVQKFYSRYLRIKNADNIANLNKTYGTNYSSFEEVLMPDKPVFQGMAAVDWNNFINGWQDPLS
ncbi:MAG: hypothetical protein KAS17_13125 [Victivallaceae bacterium]|nr:hypothetical protein [Victivallaceae bacterium]